MSEPINTTPADVHEATEAPAAPRKKRSRLLVAVAVVAVALVAGGLELTFAMNSGTSTSASGEHAFQNCSDLKATVQRLTATVNSQETADAASKELSAEMKKLADIDPGSKFSTLTATAIKAIDAKDSNAAGAAVGALVDYCEPILAKK